MWIDVSLPYDLGDAGNDSTAPQSTTGEPSNDTSAVSAKDTSAVSEKSGDRDAKTKKMKSSSKKRSSKSLDKGSENKAVCNHDITNYHGVIFFKVSQEAYVELWHVVCGN